LAELQTVADVVTLRGPEAFLTRTRSYWTAWVNKEDREFGDLSPRVAELYRRCLLVVRTQVDAGGAVLAANDADVVKFARDTYSYMWPRDAALAVYAMDQAGYIDPVTGLPEPSYDLWEERRGVMSFTAAAVWAGLKAAANFAQLYGEMTLADRYRAAADGIQVGARRFLFDPELNRFIRRIYV